MSRLLIKLCGTNTLLFLFFLTLIMTGFFGLIMHIWEFVIIDELYNASVILSHIGQLTPYQIRVHIWMTATLDVAYPFAYGFLFIGVALRAFKKYQAWLIMPSIVVIPIDLLEGIVQVFLLLGHEEIVVLKTILTPLKLIFFSCGCFIFILGLLQILLEWLNKHQRFR